MMTRQRTAVAPPKPKGAATWELISADIAYELLTEQNKHNRPLDPRTVSQYAADMRAGRFDANGETIKLDRDQQLVDGQHRLMAVVETELAQWFLVVRELSPKARDTVDIGRRRNLGQQLGLDGEKSGATLAAAARMVYAYEQTGVPVTKMLAVKPTDQQLRDVLARHPGIHNSAERWTRGILSLSRATIVGLHYLFTSVDKIDADNYFQLLASGAGLEAKHPILVLRDRLMREQLINGRSLDVKVATAFTIRAFNAYRKQERLAKLQWGGGGADATFPRIKNCKLPILGAYEEEIIEP
jgi:hypothetical protein